MNQRSGRFSIVLASLPDRDAVVAELFDGETQIAEVSHVEGELRIELYVSATREGAAFRYKEFVLALKNMGDELHLFDPESTSSDEILEAE